VLHLSVEEILVMHERLAARFGGPAGLRDAGLLDSALYRPQSGYYRDLAEMAAALFESLLMTHPFVDKKNRIAFFATDAFLRLNGWKLDVDADRARTLLIGLLEAGKSDFDHLLPWIRETLVKLDL
jgi:death-on-curing protein